MQPSENFDALSEKTGRTWMRPSENMFGTWMQHSESMDVQ